MVRIMKKNCGVNENRNHMNRKICDPTISDVVTKACYAM